MEKVIGNCGKHPGYNMVNCPMCAIEEQNQILGIKYYAVEYAGYWHIQTSPYYGEENILDAEQVGAIQAEANAKRIVDLLNRIEGVQASVATEV